MHLLHEDILHLSYLNEVVVHLVIIDSSCWNFASLVFLRFWTFSRFCILLFLNLLILDRLSCHLFKLGKTDLRTFRVLFKHPIICFLPKIEDVVEARVSLGLSSCNKITDLHALFSKFCHSLVVFCQDLSFTKLKLLKVSLLLDC